MKADMSTGQLVPAELMAEVEVMARAWDRAATDMVREAIELYLREHRSPQTPPDLREVAARIRKRREGNVLPEGVSIRDLQTHRRA